jgi:hypothetical protein
MIVSYLMKIRTPTTPMQSRSLGGMLAWSVLVEFLVAFRGRFDHCVLTFAEFDEPRERCDLDMKRHLLTETIHYYRHELISPRHPLMLSVLNNPITKISSAVRTPARGSSFSAKPSQRPRRSCVGLPATGGSSATPAKAVRPKGISWGLHT